MPVWDYVLVTEPLDAAGCSAIGWARRQGVSDVANQFHYYRLTADDRILWGGYDAVYHCGNGVGAGREQRDATFAAWRSTSSARSRSSRASGSRTAGAGRSPRAADSSPSAGTSHGGRVAYAAGHTGLGIGASRFGARVALDLLPAASTEATRLAARARAAAAVPARAAALGGIGHAPGARAGRPPQGRRGPWLRLLDRLGRRLRQLERRQPAGL